VRDVEDRSTSGRRPSCLNQPYVLMADPGQAMRQHIMELGHLAGMAVEHARDGAEALQLVVTARRPPTLIISRPGPAGQGRRDTRTRAARDLRS